MDYVSVEQTDLDFELTQMGAKVTSINGLICFVKFEINGTELFYVYNINSKDQFYLQKVLPYPVGAGLFSNPAEIVDYIKNDMKEYKKAAESSNFERFVKINQSLDNIIQKIERTYMNHDISSEKLSEISEKIAQIDNILDKVQDGL